MKQSCKFIFLDYFVVLLLSSPTKTSAMLSSVVKAKNLAGTTNWISLFLFPVTFANSFFSVFALRKFFNNWEAASNRLLRIWLLRATLIQLGSHV